MGGSMCIMGNLVKTMKHRWFNVHHGSIFIFSRIMKFRYELMDRNALILVSYAILHEYVS